MFDYLNGVFESVNPQTAYAILFISALIENTFPPIPGDTVTVVGAYLISVGYLGFWGVYLSTTLGSVVGFFIMYLIGRKFGRTFIKSDFRKKMFNERRIKKAEIWFARYGYGVIAANRFLSGTRSVISLFAGSFHLKPLPVLLYATLSALVWNGLLIYGGYLLGVNWEMISAIVKNYNRVIIVLMVILVVILIVRRRHKKNKRLSMQKDG
ncbi:MAG: DedA family protein [Caldithrix sp.]|nr:DedA family protein [Caldithrix sp.]